MAKKKHYPSPDRSVSYELSQILQNQKVRSRKIRNHKKNKKNKKNKKKRGTNGKADNNKKS